MAYVVPHPKGWAVLGEGNCRVTSVHETQEEAIRQAQKISQKWKTHGTEDQRGLNCEPAFRRNQLSVKRSQWPCLPLASHMLLLGDRHDDTSNLHY